MTIACIIGYSQNIKNIYLNQQLTADKNERA